MSNTKQMTRGQAETIILQLAGEDYGSYGSVAEDVVKIMNNMLDAVHEQGPRAGQRMRAALVVLGQDAINVYRNEQAALASNKYAQE